MTSSKPIYQPGQTMHLRARALQTLEDKPVGNATLTFEVADGKGNLVFKRSVPTDQYGIAAQDFRLATLVNMGTYQLRVSGAGMRQNTVEVSHYVLPKFDVSVMLDKPWYTAGATLNGTIQSRYFFGKNASGAMIAIEASTLDTGSNVFQRVMGMADDQGRSRSRSPCRRA